MDSLDESSGPDPRLKRGRTNWEWCRLGLWVIAGITLGYFDLVPGKFRLFKSPPEGVSGAAIFGVLFLFTGWIYEVFTNDKFSESPRKIALWIVIFVGLIPILGMLVIALILLFNNVTN